jgi:transposase
MEVAMRGEDAQTASLFSYVSCDAGVPPDHPLRLIQAVVGEVLDGLTDQFAALYAPHFRPSIPPEKLLRAS